MRSLKQALKYLLLLAIALLLLWFSFRGVEWSTFISELKRVNFWWIALSMAASVMVFWLRAVRWRLIILPLDPTVKRVETWNGINIGYLTNFALPRAGELARCGVVTKKGTISFERVVGTVILERAIDLLSLLLVTLSLFFLKWERFGNFIKSEILSGVGERFSLSIILLLGLIVLLLLAALWSLFRFKGENSLVKKGRAILVGLIEGIVAGFKVPNRGLFLLHTLLIWVGYWFMSYSTIQAFPAAAQYGLGGSDALFLTVVGALGWLVPVQGGIGAYHFILSFALTSIYSIEQSSALLFATISHESQMVTMVIFGSISLISFYLQKRRAQ